MSYIKKQLVPLKIKYESSTPATPETGFGVIYFDSTSQLPYFRNAAGSSGAISSPTFPLDATAGSVSNPSIYFGDSDSGLYSAGLNQLQFATAGTLRFSVVNNEVRVDSSFLRIGTGTSNNGVITVGITAGDLDYKSNSHRFFTDTGNSILDLDNDLVSVYQPMAFRNNNADDLGRTPGGTDFKPRHVYVGTSIQVGTSGAASASEIANFTSTTKGVVFPNATSAAVVTPVAGMVIFDTGINKLKVYNGTTWETITSI
jgi:hypothetical protein